MSRQSVVPSFIAARFIAMEHHISQVEEALEFVRAANDDWKGDMEEYQQQLCKRLVELGIQPAKAREIVFAAPEFEEAS